MVFYEAPHKLLKTLQDMLACFGDRDIALCRELTKLHEEVIRTSLSAAVDRFSETPPRGEFVLVLRGRAKEEGPAMTEQAALAAVERHRAAGLKLKEACRRAAEETGYAANALYQLALAGKEKE